MTCATCVHTDKLVYASSNTPKKFCTLTGEYEPCTHTCSNYTMDSSCVYCPSIYPKGVNNNGIEISE